jgi:radical SAM protein with 4Fe4S-binding SPASM domain
VPNEASKNALHVSDERFFNVIRCLEDYQNIHDCFDRIALPQPIRLCSVPADLVKVVSEWNIPCNIGLCTASVNAYGEVTPCNLVKEPVLGSAVDDSLSGIWQRFDGEAYCKKEHLSVSCYSCEDLSRCGGGCKGFWSALYLK